MRSMTFLNCISFDNKVRAHQIYQQQKKLHVNMIPTKPNARLNIHWLMHVIITSFNRH